MILSLTVFVSLAMLSFGNIATLSSSLTFVPPYLPPPPFVLNLLLDKPNIPSIIAPNPPIEFVVQPSNIFYASPRSPSNEQVEDEQVKDKLPNFEPRSLTLAPLEDLAQYIPPRHLTQVRFIFAHLLNYHCYTALVTLHKSHTYCKASTNPLWQIAMKKELNALSKNHTWDLVTLSLRKSVVSCKWIYKTKTRFDGSTKCYKACPLAKGFTQEYEIDYEMTFAPITQILFVCALLVVATASKWELFQMDVKNAFFKGNLSEKVYMQPPLSFSIELNNVCNL